LTDSAKKYVVKVATVMGEGDELLYGRKKVVDIIRFTEPTAAMGMTVSQVTYTWKLMDIADWARNLEVDKRFHTGRFLSAADTPQEAQMGLVLSNDGWHVPRAF
jgi:hypothetical protein